MSRYDLLPANATQLERDLSRAISSLPALGPLIEYPIQAEGGDLLADENGQMMLRESSVPLKKPGGVVPIIRTAKRTNIPDSVVPWLVYEYGLGEILPYLGDDQRRALAEGVLWQRVRGTPDSVRIALGWIGVTGLIEESESGTARWAEYQLGLAAATSGDDVIDQVMAIAQISSPVRSRLQRIYAVYDFRRFVLDDSLLSDGGMLSDHSGVRPRPDWPQISYGQIHASLIEEGTTVASTHTDVVGVMAEMSDRFILSRSKLDEEWHTINHPALLTNLGVTSVRYIGQTWAAIKWQPTAWGDVNVVASSSLTEEINSFANTIFEREAGGAILTENMAPLAFEDY